jgi:GT2 family glycosyltransferase
MVEQELDPPPIARREGQAPALTILIVNRNSASYLQDCLRSVLDTLDGIPAELVLVDGNSTDDSVAVTRRLWPSATVVSVPESLGSVRGNNMPAGATRCS